MGCPSFLFQSASCWPVQWIETWASVREATKVPLPRAQDVANILGPGRFQMALFWAPPRPQDVGNILGTRCPQIQDPRLLLKCVRNDQLGVSLIRCRSTFAFALLAVFRKGTCGCPSSTKNWQCLVLPALVNCLLPVSCGVVYAT